MQPPRRIHITGGPGSGKTTLADRLGLLLGAPVYHLDAMGRARSEMMADPDDLPLLMKLREAELEELIKAETWVSEGAFVGDARSLYRHADVIVWMDLPWRIAAYRIVSRHVKLGLAGKNPWPGVRRMLHFWRWSRRYANRNAHGFNEYGTPKTRETLEGVLTPYLDKVVICRGEADVQQFIGQFLRQPP